MRDAGNYSPGYDLDAMKAALEAEGSAFTLFGGEPLLMNLEDLEEILRWGHEKFGWTGIQTNGSLITEHHLRLFKTYNVSVGLSVDGPEELNDSRWAGSVEKTREATAASMNAISALCEAGLRPSLIITLYRGNASRERLPRLLAWIQEMDAKRIPQMRVHLLEVDHAEVRSQMLLTEEETIYACFKLMDLELKTLKLDLFEDMEKLLAGASTDVSCIWGACDPLTTPAVQAVNGLGGRSNCSRTNKDGVDWVKAPTHGSERYRVLYNTPYEDGGCQGCKYFFACKGQCYSDDTEVLTQRGFTLFSELQPSDMLATCDNNGYMSYAKPTRLIRYPFIGGMLHFLSSGYDLLVTPDHPMMVWDKDNNIVECRADQVSSNLGLRLKKNAIWTGVESQHHTLTIPIVVRGKEWCTPIVESVPMDLWLEFLGWFVSEGSTNRCPQARGWMYRTSVHQKDKKVIERVCSLLTEMGFNPHIRNNPIWCVSLQTRQAYEELAPLGKALTKCVPNYVKTLSTRQIKIFLDALFSGDGSSRKANRARDGEMRWECYYTSSRQLVDDVQELLLKCGLSSTVKTRSMAQSNIARAARGTWACTSDAYELFVRHVQQEPIVTTPSIEPYQGEVFDVTMPDSPTIYVRRNGKTVWGHNCPGTAIDGDWRNRSEQCLIFYNVFERIENRMLFLGQKPISADLPRRQLLEQRLLEDWDQRDGTPSTGNSHGDHWDAPEGFAHVDDGFTVHGDAGVTVTHGDVPHGDSI